MNEQIQGVSLTLKFRRIWTNGSPKSNLESLWNDGACLVNKSYLSTLRFINSIIERNATFRDTSVVTQGLYNICETETM